MISRDYSGKISIECDVGDPNCDGSFTLNNRDFNDTWNSAKAEGWQARQVAGEWMHSCPNCKF